MQPNLRSDESPSTKFALDESKKGNPTLLGIIIDPQEFDALKSIVEELEEVILLLTYRRGRFIRFETHSPVKI